MDNDLSKTRDSRVEALNSLTIDYNDNNNLNQHGAIGFVTAAGAPMPIPSQHALDNAITKYNHKPVETDDTQQSLIPNQLEKSFKSDQPFNKHVFKNQQSTPFKPPLINSNRQLDNATTPKSSRPRLSLGISSNKPTKRQKFVTPFKQGVIPSPQLGASENKPIKNKEAIKSNPNNRVFNLRSSSERKSMADYGVRPWGYTLAYLKAVSM